MKYKKYFLDNGAKIYYIHNRINQISAVRLTFACGGRVDTIPGLAHFTEHMFFSGTDKLNREEVTKKYYDFIDTNAYTNDERITFVGNVFSNELKDYLSFTADLITKSPFKKSAIENEKPVVQQEIARNADKFEKSARCFNLYNNNGEIVFKNRVLGNKKSVASIERKDVINFVNKYFVANNLEVYITSPYSFAKIKKLVCKYFIAKLPVKTEYQKLPRYILDTKNKEFVKVQTVDIEKTYLFINFTYDKSIYDRLFCAKQTYLCIMLNDTSEGIKRDLRLRHNLVYSARFSNYAGVNNSTMTLATQCEKENINDILKVTAQYLKEALAKGFSQAFVDKIKRECDYSEKAFTPDIESDLDDLDVFAVFGKQKFKRKKVFKRMKASDCNQVLRETFQSASVSVSTFGNAKKQDIMTQKELKDLFNFNK